MFFYTAFYFPSFKIAFSYLHIALFNYTVSSFYYDFLLLFLCSSSILSHSENATLFKSKLA